MKSPPTIVIDLVEWSPPLFRVVSVDVETISESNHKPGEVLTATDLDYIMDFFGDLGVQVSYPKA